jgi:fatty-acyl-CoA synthase
MAKPNKDLSEWIDVLDVSELMSITLGELIETSAKKFPDTEALVYSNQPEVEDIRWTYKDLDEMSSNLAKAFIDAGFNPGDTVGVWGPNHPEWILTEYALAKAGLRIVTLNPLYKEKE